MKKRTKIFLILMIGWVLGQGVVVGISNDLNTQEQILTEQQKELGISDFIGLAEKYTNDTDEMDIKNIFSSALVGKTQTIGLFNKVSNLFTLEIKEAIRSIGLILIIIIIHSILKSIHTGPESGTILQITYFVEMILIIGIVLTSFSKSLEVVKSTIQNLVGFTNSLIPIMMTLMLTTGSITSASVTQPILLLLTNFIGNSIAYVILPIILMATSLGLISNLSDEIKIEKIAKFFHSGAVWILGIIMTLFVTVLSLEGTLTQTVDGVTAKTTKAAVSTVIPLVGKILGDATDAVIGCAGILKNAVGIVGMIVIVSICIVPIVKLTVYMIFYYFASAIAEPMADVKVVKLLGTIGDTFKTLLAIICCITVVLIIGLTIVIRMSNATLLYR